MQQAQPGTRQFAAAKADEEDILRCYCLVVALFEQLQVSAPVEMAQCGLTVGQMDILLSTWGEAQDQHMVCK